MSIPGLPDNLSQHGASIDALLAWIFWITTIVTVAVLATLVVFLIRYRAAAGRKSDGPASNWKLEVMWTAIPLALLAVLSVASTRVWNAARAPLSEDDPNRLRVLVIAQQFKWNFVYAGADNRLGRYLVYPKPTDLTWPPYPDRFRPGTLTTRFKGTDGPASVTQREALRLIADYIEQANPLGKDFTDPDGLDDDWTPTPGRPLVVPVGRPVEVMLASKDVIHDFFLPNFRIKLDAVPGLIGQVTFTPTQEGKFEIVCEEFCGPEHFTMRGEMHVVKPDEH
jgi:cytochrome c oxidase subunit 2